MAEFTEVMKQARRMCRQIVYCNECPLNLPEGCKMQPHSLPNDWDVEELEKTACIVMDWAAAHPEPRYPSWHEAWKQLFPDGQGSPCPATYDIKYEPEWCGGDCKGCKDRPIPADIAEKLGIKPIEGTIEQPKMSQIKVSAFESRIDVL